MARSLRQQSSLSDSMPSETTTAPTSRAKETMAEASDWRTGSSSMPHTSVRSSLRMSGFTRVTWRKEEKPEPTHEVLLLEHGGGDVQREVDAVREAVVAVQREADDRELELHAEVDRVRVEEAALRGNR